MAGLHELRFTKEKPLLRGQDTELVSWEMALALASCVGCWDGGAGATPAPLAHRAAELWGGNAGARVGTGGWGVCAVMLVLGACLHTH